MSSITGRTSGGVASAGALRAKSPYMRPTSRLPPSSRALSARLSSRAQSAPLSYDARSAKIQWEAAHGEPCPYAYACPRAPAKRKRQRRPAAAPMQNNTDTQHGGVLPTGMPGARSQCYGFGKGFYRNPSTISTPQQTSNTGREARGEYPSSAGPASGAPRVAGAGCREGLTTSKKGDSVGVKVGVKPSQRRRAAPTLLEIHQRVIDAALLEVARPRDGPFENLGERLGGEREAFTYYSQDGDGSSEGRNTESTACGPARLREATSPKRRTSSATGKRRALNRTCDRPRTSAGPRFGTLMPDGPRQMDLPRCNEPWKIPLLRTSWTPNNNRYRSINGDPFGDTEYDLLGSGSDKERPTSAAAASSAEDAAQSSTAAGAPTHSDSVEEQSSGKNPRPRAESTASLPAESLPVSRVAASQHVEEMVSKTLLTPLPAAEVVDNDGIEGHAAAESDALSCDGVSVASGPESRTAAKRYVEDFVSQALLTPLPAAEVVDHNGIEEQALAESDAPSCDGASVVGGPETCNAAKHYVEETVSNALRGAFLSTKAVETVQRDGAQSREQVIASESRVVARECAREYLQRSSQGRLAGVSGERISGSQMPRDTAAVYTRPPETDGQLPESLSPILAQPDVFGKFCHCSGESGAASPTSASISRMSSDSSSIEFVLNDDWSTGTTQLRDETQLDHRAGAGLGSACSSARAGTLTLAATAAVEEWVSSAVSKSTRTDIQLGDETQLDDRDGTVLGCTCSIARVGALALAATEAVEEWVSSAVSKSASATTQQTSAGATSSPSSVSDQTETTPGTEHAACGGQLPVRHTDVPEGDPNNHHPGTTPLGGGMMRTLPLGFLKDIVERRASLKPVVGSRPTSASVEDDMRLESGSRQQRERCAQREAAERDSALRELESLTRAEGLDRYDPGAFSRGEVYGEGRHSVVYSAYAARPCGKGENMKEHQDARGAASTAEAIRHAAAATMAREAIVEVLTVAVAAGVTTEAASSAVSAMPMVVSTALIESVVPASISAVAATMKTVLAVKEFRYARADVPVAVLRKAHREVSMHLRVSGCTHVVALRGVWLTPRVTLLLEPMSDGNLHRFVRDRAAEGKARSDTATGGRGEGDKGRPCTPAETAWLVAGAGEGLAALHGAGVVHRDVKSHNVMVVKRRQGIAEGATFVPGWEAKLGDLGSATLVAPEGETALTGETGTSGWMAPEVFGGQGYGTPADVFSLGVLIWDAFVCGARDNPLCGLSEEACKLGDGLRPPWPRPPLASVPPDIERLAERCWVSEPGSRPTAGAVAEELRSFAASVAGDLAEATTDPAYI